MGKNRLPATEELIFLEKYRLRKAYEVDTSSLYTKRPRPPRQFFPHSPLRHRHPTLGNGYSTVGNGHSTVRNGYSTVGNDHSSVRNGHPTERNGHPTSNSRFCTPNGGFLLSNCQFRQNNNRIIRPNSFCGAKPDGLSAGAPSFCQRENDSKQPLRKL